jgi:flagellar biosynthesis/type III secretory pathway protein FliH
MCEAILELFQDEVDIATKKAREEGISEGIEQGKEQGIEQGMTLAIITVLRKKGDVPMSLKEKINKEKNVDVMESWLELTTEVSSVEEFEEKMY